MTSAPSETMEAKAFPSIWSRKLHGAAIAAALDFVCAHEWTVTGYVAVMGLNPYGAPKTIRSLAVVVQDGSDALKATEALRDYIIRSSSTSSAPSSKSPIYIDTRCAETLGMLIIKAGDAQLVTLTALPLHPNDCMWKVPVIHDARTWLVVQYAPACLRAHLFYTCAYSLVRSLDGFIAERCLWGMHDGLITQPPVVPPSGRIAVDPTTDSTPSDGHSDAIGPKLDTDDVLLSMLWSLASEWAGALVHIDTLDDLSLPSFLVLEDVIETHREALALHYEDGLDPLRAFCSTQNPAAFLALVFLGKPWPFLASTSGQAAY